MIKLLFMAFLMVAIIPAVVNAEAFQVADMHRSKEEIKSDILKLAERFKGEGDPDFSKQKQLNVLVEELLKISPQPPVKDRIKLLVGSWHQIWGSYDYRNNKRGVDPNLSPDEIYQVVFEGGYYYNVNPERKSDKIGLLRGVYNIVSQDSDFLKVKFTDFPATSKGSSDKNLWELPALAETGELKDQSRIVPKLIVRLFFGGGVLREVYTDEDMRITYGDDDIKDREDEFIYVMKRVTPTLEP